LISLSSPRSPSNIGSYAGSARRAGDEARLARPGLVQDSSNRLVVVLQPRDTTIAKYNGDYERFFDRRLELLQRIGLRFGLISLGHPVRKPER
jgi:hypothetical protein